MLPKKIIVLAQIHKIWQDIQCEFFCEHSVPDLQTKPSACVILLQNIP